MIPARFEEWPLRRFADVRSFTNELAKGGGNELSAYYTPLFGLSEIPPLPPFLHFSYFLHFFYWQWSSGVHILVNPPGKSTLARLPNTCHYTFPC